MKITVRNLGPLKEAKIDLKPLTIFVGPNNTGKTWLAYTLASIFSPLGIANYMRNRDEDGTKPVYRFLKTIVQKALNTGSASFDLVGFVDKYGEEYFNDVARFIAHDMHDFMGTRPVSFDDLGISVDLAENKETLLKRILNVGIRVGNVGDRPGNLFNIRKKVGNKRIYINIAQSVIAEDSVGEDAVSAEITEDISPDFADDFITTNILTILHISFYNNVRVFPTERTTFITFPFPTQVIEKTRAALEEITEKNAVRMVHMVGDFLEMVSKTIENEPRTYKDRLKSAESNSRIKKYLDLAQLMEDEVLGGKVILSSLGEEASSDLPQSKAPSFRRILFQHTANKDLEISIASSMVKELSSLVMYLRYLAKPGDLIVIDEPEMNLHPRAQMKMIEFLAMLINAGLRIIITTHSPYLIDHLTNLMKAFEAENREEICNLFTLKQIDAFIAKDRVSVYLFDEGEAKSIIDKEGSINLGTFGDVSDDIDSIYFAL